MQKPTAAVIVTLIAALTIIAVTGEFFAYRYFAANPSANSGQNSSAGSTNSTAGAGQGSGDNQMLSFRFDSPLAVGSINQNNHTVSVVVPADTDVLHLSPSIQVSQGATVSPGAGATQDFMKPLTYTVTAQNGATQDYTVTVTVASILDSGDNSMTSFSFDGLTPPAGGFIDDNRYAVHVVVPDNTDVTNLAPTIKVAKGASVVPASGQAEDFTNPVTYTVTAQNGLTQTYTVTVIPQSQSG